MMLDSRYQKQVLLPKNPQSYPNHPLKHHHFILLSCFMLLSFKHHQQLRSKKVNVCQALTKTLFIYVLLSIIQTNALWECLNLIVYRQKHHLSSQICSFKVIVKYFIHLHFKMCPKMIQFQAFTIKGQ